LEKQVAMADTAESYFEVYRWSLSEEDRASATSPGRTNGLQRMKPSEASNGKIECRKHVIQDCRQYGTQPREAPNSEVAGKVVLN
jgi:hypothetical protein